MEIIILLIAISVFRSIMESRSAKAKSVVNKTQKEGSKEHLDDYLPSADEKKRPQMPQSAEDLFESLAAPLSGGETKKAKKAKPAKSKPKAEYNPPPKPKSQPPQPEVHEHLRPTIKPIKASVAPHKSPLEQKAAKTDSAAATKPAAFSLEVLTEPSKAAVTLHYDRETIVQGVIWSEILSKPKALRR